MATLQKIGDTFYIRFRYGGKAFRRSLQTTITQEAEAACKQVELTLHRINTGMMPSPTADMDAGIFILSGGKLESRIVLPEPPPPPTTLRTLWTDYEASFPVGAKISLTTEGTHFRHFFKHLGEDLPLASLTTDRLQGYIHKRLAEAGRRGRTVAPDTIVCELETLSHVWNRFALPRQLVDADFEQTFGGLEFGKRRTRQPFRTWEQIDRQVARGQLTANQIQEMWDCLFLDLGQIDEVLDFVRDRNTDPQWVYPMFVFTAHTGARRSEMIRSEIHDWDFDNGVVHIRERKRNCDVEFTYRAVPISPRLSEVMSSWFERYPGGVFALCDEPNRTVTANVAAKVFRRAVDASKWNVLRGWHIFRHSIASNMACEGIDQRLIDATLGHQTEEMRRRYRHLFPSQHRAVMASIFAKR